MKKVFSTASADGMSEPPPKTLSINAWTGEPVPPAPVMEDAFKSWTVTRGFASYSKVLAAEVIDPRDWKNSKVGWGVVLAENDSLKTEAERATAVDAPEPIRRLVESRPNAVVLRYRKESADRGFIRRYYLHRPAQDLAITGGRYGTDDECVPRYLLIYGSPSAIPWDFQYRLSLDFFTGRLDLEDQGLENYVTALLGDWQASDCRRASPVLWSTEHGPQDITRLMRLAIGDPLASSFRDDKETRDGVRAIFGDDATTSNLLEALHGSQPALVVTTSHGMTGPLSDPAAMKVRLGWLVDQAGTPIDPDSILAQWEPDGAIWYAHACCSAGGDGRTLFEGLVSQDSMVAQVLQGVAAQGARVARVPRALLGAKKPLRAFIGHVEPTFDWTLQAQTGQQLTSRLLEALYDRMYLKDPEPVGLAFEQCYQAVGSLMTQWDQEVRLIGLADTGERAGYRSAAMRTKLTALDRSAVVILGDPTVALPRQKT